MTHQRLTDELEKALRAQAYDGGMGALSPDQFTDYVRGLAVTAANVVEEAHTPTDDEREALDVEGILDRATLDEYTRVDPDETYERLVVKANALASTVRRLLADRSHGEPSDAQKISAAITRASVRGVEFMDQGEGPGDAISLSDIFLAGFASAIDAVREELRAAGGAR